MPLKAYRFKSCHPHQRSGSKGLFIFRPIFAYFGVKMGYFLHFLSPLLCEGLFHFKIISKKHPSTASVKRWAVGGFEPI